MKGCKRVLPFLLLILLLTGCAPKAVQKEIFAMDTVMSLTAYGKHAEIALDQAVDQINVYALELDPEVKGSKVYQLTHGHGESFVYRINHAQGEATGISVLMDEMLTAADTVYRRTNGALDLTIYPAVKAWGFIDGNYTVPDEQTLTALAERVDFSAVIRETRQGEHYVTLPADMELSFGAVAKGAVAQEVIGTLKDAGVESAIISLGGNVQTLGQKPDGTNWNVAVQDPGDLSGSLGILSVGETAVVTSGSYQRYFEADGKTYHHILDPKTLSPADSGLVSVTVICADGAMADCLSTALFVLGEDGALDYWRTYGGFELILVTEDGRVILTDGLEGTFTPGETDYTYQYTG